MEIEEKIKFFSCVYDDDFDTGIYGGMFRLWRFPRGTGKTVGYFRGVRRNDDVYKVEIVYDTDEDENGQETRNYYEPEGESEWLGETVDVKYQVVVNEDGTVSLKGMEDDGSITTKIDGAYNEAKNEFYYETEEIGGKNATTLLFSDADGTLSAKGTMLFTHTETGLVNEIAFDLKKI